MSSISVIIPSRNEEENIKFLITDIENFLKINQKIQINFIIVDDFSTDKSVELYRKEIKNNSNIQLITLDKQVGPMGAEIVGFDNAKTKFITILPADLQTKVESLQDFIKICENYDIIWSYRTKRKDNYIRKIISNIYNSLVKLFLNTYPQDLHSVFIMEKKIYEQNKNYLLGDSAFFHLKLAYLAKNKKLKQTELPIDHFPRKFGSANGVGLKQILLISKDFFNLIKIIFKLSKQRAF